MFIPVHDQRYNIRACSAKRLNYLWHNTPPKHNCASGFKNLDLIHLIQVIPRALDVIWNSCGPLAQRR